MIGLTRQERLGSWDLWRSSGPVRLEPVERFGIRVMSAGFLLGEDQALAFAAPLVQVVLHQLLTSVAWGELDELLVDLPPGTADLQQQLLRLVRPAGAVIVVGPQDVAHLDARKVLDLLGEAQIPIAEVTQPHSVRALVEDGDVLVSTVGPFLRYGEPALEAAVAAGAHYVDCTGEAGFVRRVFGEYGRRAQDAGCVLLTAFGYDFVPGNLAGALAARAAGGQASRVEIGYFTAGDPRRGLSSGTRATMATGMGQQVHALVGGQLVLAPFARRVRVFADGGRRRPAGLFGGTEPLALPRVAPALTNVAVFLGWFAGATRLLQVGSYVLPLLVRTPGIAAALRRRGEQALARTGQGPGEQQRSAAAGESIIIAVAADRGGRELASVRLRGINGCDLTGRLLAWAAAHLAAGRVTMAGALGPVDAFGVEALEAACREAGLGRD